MPRRLLFPLLILAAALVLVLLSESGERAQPRAATENKRAPTTPDAAPADPVDEGEASGQRTLIETAATDAAASALEANASDTEVVAWLEGFVLDEENEGLSGVSVLTSVENELVSTDSDGRFVLGLREPFNLEAPRRLTIWHAERGIATDTVHPGVPVRIVLAASGPRELRVLSEHTEAPIPGSRASLTAGSEWRTEPPFQRVRHRFELPWPVSPTDGEGRTQIPGGSGYWLLVEAQGYETEATFVRNTFSGTVSLRDSEKVAFRLIDRRGAPMAGSRLVFPRFGLRTKTDESGWFTLPVGERVRDGGVQVVHEERAFWFTQRLDRLKVAGTQDILFDHYERRGRLILEAGADASAYEVGTSADNGGWGDNYSPDPYKHAEQISWVKVSKAGEFNVAEGWQGRSTHLVVRRTDTSEIVQITSLEGEGPYEIPLVDKLALTITVRAESAERLAGAVLHLGSGGFSDDRESTEALSEGRAEFALEPGGYSVRLELKDEPVWLHIGSVKVAEGTDEAVFDLGRLRALTGRVVVDNEPVFPCRVRFNAEPQNGRHDGYWGSAETDERGEWTAATVPGVALEAVFEPGDPWLRSGREKRLHIPADATRFDHAIPFAVLEIAVGDIDSETLSKVTVSRYTQAEDGNYRHSIRAYDNRLPKLPDLSTGLASVRTSPCRAAFWLSSSTRILARDQIDIREGERRQIVLDLVDCGELLFRVRGELRAVPGVKKSRDDALAQLGYVFESSPSGRAQAGEVELEPFGDRGMLVSAPVRTRGFSPKPRPDGLLSRGHRLAPGRWRATLHGPIFTQSEGGEEIALAGEGSWSTELSVEPGRRTTIWVEVDEAGVVTLGPEIGDIPAQQR